jgi:hypothetical protein
LENLASEDQPEGGHRFVAALALKNVRFRRSKSSLNTTKRYFKELIADQIMHKNTKSMSGSGGSEDWFPRR